MSEVFLGDAWAVNHFVAGDKLGHFGASLVYNCKYAVEPLRPRQVCDEIHGHILEQPFSCRHIKTLKGCFLPMKVHFGLLALGATLDVLFHEVSESGSLVVLFNQFPGVCYSRVSSCGGIMDLS